MSLLSNDNFLGDLFSGDLFSFGGSVGRNGDNDRGDVIKAQTLLADAGYLDLPAPGIPTGWPGDGLTRAITNLQKDNGLEADGLLLPMVQGRVAENGVGETLHLLQQQGGSHLKHRPAMTPQQVDSYWQTPRSAAAEVQVGEAQPVFETLPPMPQAKPMPLPDHKRDFFLKPQNEGVWSDSQSAIRQQLPGQHALGTAIGRIYAEEGGRIRDPNGTAVGGITEQTLQDMQGKGLLSGLPKDAKPGDLTPDQQVQAYRAYLNQNFRNVPGGAKALEQLDPDLAHAVADAMFMHGSVGGVEFVQKAIAQTGIDPEIKVDGGVGPQTFAALRKANEDPKLRDILQNRIAELRLDAKEWKQGEIDRISRARPGAWRR
ncbi:MAG: peptidoglycan-binding protein [Alphaproteobacteria bacterium]|nr:peptidoglycan-binding protein [Alphaproteobacteria bacterium]